MIRVGDITIPFGKNMFPDHSLAIKLNPDMMFDNRGSIQVEWLYEGDAELFTLICVKRHIDRHFSNQNVVLDLPYIPHARMDRVKNTEDVFTLKYFCEIINSLHFTTVWVRDAHSYVSLALLENVHDVGVRGYISVAAAAAKADTLFYPDEGAMKRYSEQSSMPYAFGRKARDWETGKIIGYDVVNSDLIEGKNILIVDDICSRGGTFYHAAKMLKEECGAKSVSLYVTHLEDTVTIGDLPDSGLIDHIYTTESIFPEKLVQKKDAEDKLIWGDWITILK